MPKIKKQPKSKLGWYCGYSETLEEIVIFFNNIEEEYTVCDVDIEEDTVNGSWRFIYKIAEK